MNDSSGPTPVSRATASRASGAGSSAPVEQTASPTAPQGAAAPDDIATLPFDAALEELRSVVGRLEEGGLALEASIELYERGVALHDHCSQLLDSAELRVQRLVDSAGGAPRAMDLRPDDGDER